MNRNKSLNKNVVQMTLSALNRPRPVSHSPAGQPQPGSSAPAARRASAPAATTAVLNGTTSGESGEPVSDLRDNSPSSETFDFSRDPAEVLEALLSNCEIAESNLTASTASAAVARPRNITDPFCVPYGDADVVPLSDDILNASAHPSPNTRRPGNSR